MFRKFLSYFFPKKTDTELSWEEVLQHIDVRDTYFPLHLNIHQVKSDKNVTVFNDKKESIGIYHFHLSVETNDIVKRIEEDYKNHKVVDVFQTYDRSNDRVKEGEPPGPSKFATRTLVDLATGLPYVRVPE